MIRSMVRAVQCALFSKGLAVGAAVSALVAIPAVASARHHGFHIDVALPVPVQIATAPCDTGRVWVAPIYQTVSDRSWVEPVYQTVTDRVWIEPTANTTVERVFVPAQFAWRDVVSCDIWGRRRVSREQLLVAPAHFEDRQVGCTVPGHFEDVSRQQLISDGHWQDVQRQQLVTPGYWQAAVVSPVCVPPVATARLEFRLPF